MAAQRPTKTAAGRRKPSHTTKAIGRKPEAAHAAPPPKGEPETLFEVAYENAQASLTSESNVAAWVGG